MLLAQIELVKAEMKQECKDAATEAVPKGIDSLIQGHPAENPDLNFSE